MRVIPTALGLLLLVTTGAAGSDWIRESASRPGGNDDRSMSDSRCGEAAEPAAYGDNGHGACGGWCNDIRRDRRYQCKSTQRPAYNGNGWCMCQYDRACGG